MPTTTITIEGTHCASCKALIEEVAREVPGVRACTVDVATGQTVVEHDATLDWGALQRAIDALGPYRVQRGQP